LQADKDYFYNAIEGTIHFGVSGSTVYLVDLELTPSDPEFDRLGSREYTGAFIDECSQVSTKAKNIVMSRIRFKLEEYGIIPKLLLASNPTKNFLYYEFYKPWKANELLPYRKFIPALVGDNPYISKHYVENLKKLDKISKERLLYGNFEYEEDPSKLFEYDDILDMFSKQPVFNDKDRKYLSADIARFGSDTTTVVVWREFHVETVYRWAKKDTLYTIKKIDELAQKHSVPRSQVIIDEDGVGGGVLDGLRGAKGFVNNSRPFVKQNPAGKRTAVYNYGNLKSQCYFAFAEAAAQKKISIYQGIPVDLKEALIEELEQVKRKDPDKDGKVLITPKEQVKENLGRSPDLSDACMMRFYFDVVGVQGYRPLFA
jgi:hypothetical protein